MHNILSLRAKRGEVLNNMEALVDLATSETRGMSTEEDSRYDNLKAELATLDKQIQRAEEMERLKAAAAKPITSVEVTHDQSEKRESGWAVSRIVRALAACKGDPARAAAFCEKEYGDQQVAKALAAGSAGAGGFLVPDVFVSEMIDLLRPASVVRRMGAVTVPMPGGVLTWPRQTGGGTASYLGENQNIAVTEQTFGQLRMTARKLAALTPISNDLIRFASVSADNVVRNDLVAAMAQAEDVNFIRSEGLGAGPKGLRHWAPSTNVITVNATVNLANVTTDLGKLYLALRNANSRMVNCGYLMAPRTENYLRNLRDGNGNKAFPEMMNGTLQGYPYGVTTQIPINLAVTGTNESEIYFVDFNDAIIAEVPGMRIDASGEAAYHDGSSVVAAFSLDQTVIRVITEHDFAMRYESSVAVLSDVDWV